MLLRFRPLGGRFVKDCYRRNSFRSLLSSHTVESSFSSTSSSSSSVSPSSSSNSKSLIWRSLLFGIGSLGGAIAYVSYAYIVDEFDTKTRDFRYSVYYDSPNPFYSTINLSSPSFSIAPAESFRESVQREKGVIFLGTVRFLISSVMGDYFPMKPLPDKLLPDMDLDTQHKCTLVLDLNGTLVRSDWLLDLQKQQRHSLTRPGMDDFLQLISEMGYYEIVLYVDQPRADLSKLNRDPSRILYVSGHALETCLQPQNCVPIKPWNKEDVDDTTLADLLQFLEYIARKRPNDVRPLLSTFKGNDIASEFVECSKHQQRRLFGNGRLWGLWLQ